MKTRKIRVPQFFPPLKSLLVENLDAIVDELRVPLDAQRRADLAKRLESVEYQYQKWCYEQDTEYQESKSDDVSKRIRRALYKVFTRIDGRKFESLATDDAQESAANTGRPPDIALRKLVTELMQIYKSFTGRSLGTSVDQKTGEPGGPLIRFVQQCLSNLGIDKSRQAIRTLIRRILAR